MAVGVAHLLTPCGGRLRERIASWHGQSGKSPLVSKTVNRQDFEKPEQKDWPDLRYRLIPPQLVIIARFLFKVHLFPSISLETMDDLEKAESHFANHDKEEFLIYEVNITYYYIAIIDLQVNIPVGP